MIRDALLLALREIRRNMLRAFLTTLGIVIGVASVIAIVTLGNGATASITNSIGALGSNVLILSSGSPSGGFRPPGQGAKLFTSADVEALKREVLHLRAVSPEAQRSVSAVSGNRNQQTSVTGIEEDYFTAHGTTIMLGRGFTSGDARSGRAICILGQTVRKQLFGAQNPIGVRIRVRQVSCEVIGVLTPKGRSAFGQDQDDLVLMPLKAVQRRLNGNDDISTIWLGIDSQENTLRVIADVTALMRQRRHIDNPTNDDFSVRDLAQVSQTISQTTTILAAFLAAIAAVSLLVGGIGIMNIMLVSVTERTREIGIRLAIGALERDVLWQFLIEAMVMSAVGGAIGIVLGLLLSLAVTSLLVLPFLPSLSMVVIAFLFSAGIGVAFGYFPARRAARLDPIEALRHE